MPHVPMRAGFEDAIAACGSIAGASDFLRFVVDGVEEQAVTISVVTTAADTAVTAATKCFDIGVCSLRSCLATTGACLRWPTALDARHSAGFTPAGARWPR